MGVAKAPWLVRNKPPFVQGYTSVLNERNYGSIIESLLSLSIDDNRENVRTN